MATARVPGGWLSYETAGSGQPVVLLHGGAMNLHMWDQQWAVLAEQYQCIRFDARGHGQSSTPTAPFRQCDDVAALLAHLGLQRAALVGLSMGGGAAVDTALEHPSVVEALVVCGAGTNEPYFLDPWTRAQQRLQLQAQRDRDADAWVDSFLCTYLAGPYRALHAVDPSIVERCRQMALDTVHTHATPNAVLPDHAHNSWARLGDIGVPLLSVAGNLDCPDHLAMANRLVAGVPGAQSAVIQHTAHYPNMERADAFNVTLVEFLNSALPRTADPRRRTGVS
jgi:pimeloyl-ACP methyl ester carboxylesterase